MPNAIYTYFADKDALLAGLLDDLLGDIGSPEVENRDWRVGLVEIMDSSRRLVLAHPQLAAMFLSRQSVGPNAARLGEITFRLLRQGGLEGERAVEAFRTLLIYTLGFRRLPGTPPTIGRQRPHSSWPGGIRRARPGSLPRVAGCRRTIGDPPHR